MNLLLITDMARLSKVFEQLADNKTFTLRVVNNLEKGGEEIAIQKPDVVFVQTHLSGLSADILLMHLKKQLGRKRSRFVLLATPGQISSVILKHYQGWLDISSTDSDLLPAIQNLLASLLSKTKMSDSSKTRPEDKTVSAPVLTEPMTGAGESALLNINPATDIVSGVPCVNTSPSVPDAATEASLEDQGITYSPRSRLSVYSEFSSSFDNAVNRTQEPETLIRAAPLLEHKWDTEAADTIATVPPRSKSSIFLLWLAPVVAAVVLVTFLQKNNPVSNPVAVIAPPVVPLPPPAQKADQAIPAPVQPSDPSKPPATAKPDQDSRITDKAVITAIAENRGSKAATPPSAAGARPSALPDFIPRYGLDKQYGIANPGWERYRGRVTEFKVLREAQTIKAVQIIDRGGQGVPESFMKGALRQVAKKPVFTSENTEKKEGYEISRGHVSDNVKVVFYRDEQGGKLRAFVITWQ